MSDTFATEAAAFWASWDQPEPDTYAAFRGSFDLTGESAVELRICGAHSYVVWLDGEYLTEGPFRFPPGHPEYETVQATLPAGRHVIAAMVRHDGIESRILQGNVLPSFFMCQALADDKSISITWKCAPLPGHLPSGQRISPQFAWIEWTDTRLNPCDWQKISFDDSAWDPARRNPEIREWKFRPVDAERLKRLKVTPKLIAEGSISGPFEHRERAGWQTDESFPWYIRDLQPSKEINGTWRRYDLGYVMLGAPEITLDVPSGTVIEIAHSETLRNGRVTPFIPLSLGPTRNMDHFVARGGVQTFAPFIPKGGRYLEIHVGAPPDKVRFLSEEFWQRTYYTEPTGAFDCGDPLLNRIWRLGIDTLRSCSEDAIIDNPTRERGQWTGDVLLSLYIAAAGFNDLRLFKRALQHSAWCARQDGLVAGLCPGNPGYLSTYSAQWATSVLNYYSVTGDLELLKELYPYAVRNMEVFTRELIPAGIRNFDWPFVDWGYPGSKETGTEMGVNMHVLEASRSMRSWASLLDQDETAYRDLESRLKPIILAWLEPRMTSGSWEAIDYHCVTLALRNRLVPENLRPAAIDYLKRHTLSCFPNDLAAPHLSNPDMRISRLITPYFCYYSLPEFANAGEIDFVLDQIRTCWGWVLDQGLTTQPEVFGLDWSHCHVWASSPTAQLTRWLLGLVPHYSKLPHHFDFTLNPGNIDHASGKIPLIGESGAIAVSWKKTGPEQIEYELDSPVEVAIHFSAGAPPHKAGKKARLTLQKSAANWKIIDP